MSLLNFTKNFLDGLSRTDIKEELRIAQGTLSKQVIPSFESAGIFAKAQKMTHKDNLALERQLKSDLESKGFAKQPTAIADIHLRLQTIDNVLTRIAEVLDKQAPETLYGEGMQANIAACLRYIEDVSFINTFSMNLINVVYEREMAESNNRNSIEAIPPVVVQQVKTFLGRYIDCLNKMAIDSSDFDKVMKELSSLSVSQRNWELMERSHGRSRMAPFSSLVSNFYWSPIFHLRQIPVQYQKARYDSAVNKREILEMRLLYLQEEQDRKGDNPQLAKQITYVQERINRLESQIRDVEEDLADLADNKQ